MKYRKLISFCLLVIFCAQTVASSIDVHVNLNNGELKFIPINIAHHFYDEHSAGQHKGNISVDFSSDDDTQTCNHDIHHGCSGHVSFLSNNYFSAYCLGSITGSDSFYYNHVFISIISIPEFRPPITS